MARITLYVPDELKAEMDAVEGENWSDIARPAFMRAVAIRKYRRGHMESAIERLRASKAEAEKEDEMQGKVDGRAWAERDASYAELRRVAEIEVPNSPPDDWAYDALADAIDPEKDLDPRQFREQVFGSEDADLSEAYLLAFIEGATEFFDEVRDKL